MRRINPFRLKNYNTAPRVALRNGGVRKVALEIQDGEAVFGSYDEQIDVERLKRRVVLEAEEAHKRYEALTDWLEAA